MENCLHTLGEMGGSVVLLGSGTLGVRLGSTLGVRLGSWFKLAASRQDGRRPLLAGVFAIDSAIPGHLSLTRPDLPILTVRS